MIRLGTLWGIILGLLAVTAVLAGNPVQEANLAVLLVSLDKQSKASDGLQLGYLSVTDENGEYSYDFLRDDSTSNWETLVGVFEPEELLCVTTVQKGQKGKCLSIVKLSHFENSHEGILTVYRDDDSPYGVRGLGLQPPLAKPLAPEPEETEKSGKGKKKKGHSRAGRRKELRPDFKLTLKIEKYAKGSVPKVAEPIRLVDNEIVEEKPEPSFIAKYWIWFAVPFFLVAFAGGDRR